MKQTFENNTTSKFLIYARACARVLSFVVMIVSLYSTGLIAAPKNHKKSLTKEEILSKRTTEQKGLARHRLNRELVASGLSEGGLELISSLQSDSDPVVRQGAAQALGNYTQNRVVVRALSDALKTETVPAVRYALALSISLSKSFLSMKALEKLAGDPDPAMRRQVAAGLKRQEGVRAQQLLKKLETDSDASVRKMARTR